MERLNSAVANCCRQSGGLRRRWAGEGGDCNTTTAPQGLAANGYLNENAGGKVQIIGSDKSRE
jgi:hypothetical protein